jgi:hypothetical protein
MTRTQIQLPDELYQRAKTFAAQRELSLAEVTRRGLELFLDRFPSNEQTRGAWTLPRVDAGGIKVPLETLRDIATDDQSNRSLADR